MNILLIGSGGREHALAWAIEKHPDLTTLYVAPGNGGTRSLGSRVENMLIAATDIDALLTLAIEKKIDLTIVGPEQPLEKGIVNQFTERGLKIIGPTREAAQLETSKAFSKAFMARHRIPTAAFQTFDSLAEATEYIRRIKNYPQVIKASGLAAGKGVVIAMTEPEALETLSEIFDKKVFGAAGSEVVIEEFMQGEEASVFILTDGKNYKLLPTAQDHKRIGEGDTGKNTGGMGAYSPAPIVTPEVMRQVEEHIIIPTLEGMVAEAMPYAGFLYIGLMIENGVPKTVEFNARLGDPETQVIIPLLEKNILDVLLQSASGKLGESEMRFKRGAATTVVMASGGYPDHFETGKLITGQCHYENGKDVIVFHAGTKFEHGKLTTSGGRVLSVTALGDTLKESIEKAYDAVDQIHFDGAVYRKDIGAKGLLYEAGRGA